MTRIYFIILLLALGLLSGCDKAGDKVQNEPEKTITHYSVVDARGKTIQFEKQPQRIVCLNYSACEILTELVPLEYIVATDKWAHEDDLSNCAELIKDIPICEDNVENILQYRPDLVILASGRGTELGDILDQINIKTCVLDVPKNISEISEYIRLLGKFVDNETVANRMAQRVEDYLVENKKGPRITGVLILHPNGGTGHRGSMGHSVFEACNIENLADQYSNFGGDYLSKEQVVALNPERLIVLDWSFGGTHESAELRRKDVLTDPSYKNMRAVKNDKVIILPVRYFNCNTQYVVRNLELLKKELEKTL